MERPERSGVPLIEAAVILDVPAGTLRRWVREGCPVVRAGRKGRGCATLVDPVAVRQWLGAEARDAALLSVAGRVPDVLAEAVRQAWTQISHPAKREAAGWFAAVWYHVAAGMLDTLREECPAVPEPDRLPEAIERLRKIARDA